MLVAGTSDIKHSQKGAKRCRTPQFQPLLPGARCHSFCHLCHLKLQWTLKVSPRPPIKS